MKQNNGIPEQNPPQPPKKSTRRNCASNQLTLFLRGGYGKKSDDERLLDLFSDAEQDRGKHPYGAGAC